MYKTQYYYTGSPYSSIFFLLIYSINDSKEIYD